MDKDGSTGIVENARSFLTGDLAFLDKDNMEGWWCNFCKGYRLDWQTKGCSFDPWTMEVLVEQVGQNARDGLTGADRMDVKVKTKLYGATIVVYPGSWFVWFDRVGQSSIELCI